MKLPLVHGADLDAPLAWVDCAPVSRRRYLADVHDLALQLPSAGNMLNVGSDRYRFAVGLGAAALRGQTNLLPPNHTADMVARLRAMFKQTYLLGSDDADAATLPVRWPASAAPAEPRVAPVELDADLIAAQVLTSGSTGNPVPHAKRWGALWANSQVGARRLAAHMGRASLEGVAVVATVPAQHMYGFESSVLVALQAGASFDSGRPFYPADIVTALQRIPRPRLLVTTPLHLKTLLDAALALPAADLIVCATAPLAPQLAARAEAAFGAPLLEIYGCTEAGQVATRRTTQDPTWQTYDGVSVEGNGDNVAVHAAYLTQRVVLADTVERVDATHFRLLGRANDLINVAGKRSSLSHLNFHLNNIPGVNDGAFWLPPEAPGLPVARLVAFVVAPELTREHIVQALRRCIDAAFLPRRIVWLDALPRDPSGKLPTARLAELAARTLGASTSPEAP